MNEPSAEIDTEFCCTLLNPVVTWILLMPPEFVWPKPPTLPLLMLPPAAAEEASAEALPAAAASAEDLAAAAASAEAAAS